MKIHNTESFIEKANYIHKNTYCYDKAIYRKTREKIEIECFIHGSFFQTPDAHIHGKQGCPKCAIIKNAKGQTKSIFTFISQAENIHNKYYSYEKSIYTKNSAKIIITCPFHGDFLQTASDHLSGYNCEKCANDKRKKMFMKPLDVFLNEAKNIHGDKYDYSLVEYKGTFEKIDIICYIHGIFRQVAHTHLSGSGCKQCSKSHISRVETEWLNSLNIPIYNRQYSCKIGSSTFHFDAYIPETNTVYEFYGDYWHGNPIIYKPEDINGISKKTFGELYLKTIKRENTIKKHGFSLITIWENEFKGKTDV